MHQALLIYAYKTCQKIAMHFAGAEPPVWVLLAIWSLGQVKVVDLWRTMTLLNCFGKVCSHHNSYTCTRTRTYTHTPS